MKAAIHRNYDTPTRFTKGSIKAIKEVLPMSIKLKDSPAALVAGWKMLSDKQRALAIKETIASLNK